MRKEIYYCDKCKKETEAKTIKTISIELGSGYGRGSKSKRLELCPICSEKLGIIKRVIKDDVIVEEVQDIKDRLFDIVAEIIQEVGVQIEY